MFFLKETLSSYLFWHFIITTFSVPLSRSLLTTNPMANVSVEKIEKVKIGTYRIFERGVPIASFRGPSDTFASDAVVSGNTVETVSIQGYWTTPFTVVEPRLPFPHYELQ